MPPGSEPLQGRHAIQQFWRSALESGVAKIELQTLEVFALGLTAAEVGRYELHDRTGNMLDSGKYIVVWRSEHGRWKLHRDMFSTSLPSARK